MTATFFGFDAGPYLVVLLLGVLPNGFWRLLGLAIGSQLREDSEILVWVRFVAIALVSGVVAQLVFIPSGALASVPAWGRLGALVCAIAAYFAAGRRVSAGLAAGLLTLALAAHFAGVRTS